MKKLRPIVPILLALAAGGCASSMSGVGGSEGYGCHAPAGVQCTSVSGVYANAVRGTLPAPEDAPTSAAPSPSLRPDPAARPPRATTSLTPGSPMRSNPRVLRIWVAPWEDSDGDLHEAAVVHVVVDTGRWLIEHVRPGGRDRIDAVVPPEAPSAAPQTLPRPPGAAAAPDTPGG